MVVVVHAVKGVPHALLHSKTLCAKHTMQEVKSIFLEAKKSLSRSSP